MAGTANPYAGPASQPEPPPSRTRRTIVIAVAVTLVAVAGGLAAIVIPAYDEYTQRVQATDLMIESMPLSDAVREHYARTKRLPSGIADLGENALKNNSDSKNGRVSMGADNVITLTLTSGKTVVLRPRVENDLVQWDCTDGTLERRYRPGSCR